MPVPDGPHIITIYKRDGSMIKQPTGYGGALCHVATEPYARRHGGLGDVVPTAEADQPPYLARETETEQERAQA